jgi:23S rRNA (uracil1939-C5)-methyltransferase
MPDVAALPALCRHFVPTSVKRRGTTPLSSDVGAGACGGCATQDVPYAEQLAAKEARVRAVLAPFSPGRFAPIRPSPEPFYFRNKMEFAFHGASHGPGFPSAPAVAPDRRMGSDGAHAGGNVVLGLRERGAFDRVVDLQDCRLLSPETPVLLEAVRRWAEREGVPAYRSKARAGFLRYLVLREGKNTGQRMVHLVTAPGEPAAGWKESFLGALKETGVRADTVVWSVNETLSDVAFGSRSETLSGAGFITETLGGRAFRVSPTSFFQTNTRGAEILYKIIEDRLAPGAETLFDLYCGSGTIGLFCSGLFRRVVGVELHGPAVADAKANAAALGVPAEFRELDAAKVPADAELGALWKGNASAVADPPRPGLQGPLRRLLVQFPLERWVYVSCNPDALAKDLPVLADAYDVESAEPVDLFPHTPHVETVVTFRKRTR